MDVARGELLGGARDRALVVGVTEQIQAIIQNLNAYPRWLVASCGIILALATLWIVAKLLKWTLYVILTLAMVAVVGGGVYWWLGSN